MSNSRDNNFIKIVSVFVLVSFLVFDLAWAYPPEPVSKFKLAVPDFFNPPSGVTVDSFEIFGRSNQDKVNLIGSVLSISEYMFASEKEKWQDKMYLVMAKELGEASAGIDLEKVRFDNKNKNVLLIPYDYDRDGHFDLVIQIAERKKISKNEILGFKWGIYDKYVIRVLPENELISRFKKIHIRAENSDRVLRSEDSDKEIHRVPEKNLEIDTSDIEAPGTKYVVREPVRVHSVLKELIQHGFSAFKGFSAFLISGGASYLIFRNIHLSQIFTFYNGIHVLSGTESALILYSVLMGAYLGMSSLKYLMIAVTTASAMLKNGVSFISSVLGNIAARKNDGGLDYYKKDNAGKILVPFDDINNTVLEPVNESLGIDTWREIIIHESCESCFIGMLAMLPVAGTVFTGAYAFRDVKSRFLNWLNKNRNEIQKEKEYLERYLVLKNFAEEAWRKRFFTANDKNNNTDVPEGVMLEGDTYWDFHKLILAPIFESGIDIEKAKTLILEAVSSVSIHKATAEYFDIMPKNIPLVKPNANIFSLSILETKRMVKKKLYELNKVGGIRNEVSDEKRNHPFKAATAKKYSNVLALGAFLAPVTFFVTLMGFELLKLSFPETRYLGIAGSAVFAFTVLLSLGAGKAYQVHERISDIMGGYVREEMEKINTYDPEKLMEHSGVILRDSIRDIFVPKKVEAELKKFRKKIRRKNGKKKNGPFLKNIISDYLAQNIPAAFSTGYRHPVFFELDKKGESFKIKDSVRLHESLPFCFLGIMTFIPGIDIVIRSSYLWNRAMEKERRYIRRNVRNGVLGSSLAERARINREKQLSYVSDLKNMHKRMIGALMFFGSLFLGHMAYFAVFNGASINFSIIATVIPLLWTAYVYDNKIHSYAGIAVTGQRRKRLKELAREMGDMDIPDIIKWSVSVLEGSTCNLYDRYRIKMEIEAMERFFAENISEEPEDFLETAIEYLLGILPDDEKIERMIPLTEEVIDLSVTSGEPEQTGTEKKPEGDTAHVSIAKKDLPDMSDDDILGLIDPKYSELKKHSYGVWRYAKLMAEAIGIERNSEEMNILRSICLAHDIGGVLGYKPDEKKEQALLDIIAKYNVDTFMRSPEDLIEELENKMGKELPPDLKKNVSYIDHGTNSLAILKDQTISIPSEAELLIPIHILRESAALEKLKDHSERMKLLFFCFKFGDIFEAGNNYYKTKTDYYGKRSDDFETIDDTINFVKKGFESVGFLKDKIGVIEHIVKTDAFQNAIDYSRSPIGRTKFGISAESTRLFELVENTINNRRAETAASMNKISEYLEQNGFTGIDPEMFMFKTPVLRKNTTEEIIFKVRRILRIINENKIQLPERFSAVKENIERNIDQMRADSIVASLIVMARRAKRVGQKLIIGIDTSWIPGYKKGSTFHNAMFPLIKQIDSLEEALNSMGLNNVIIIRSNKDDLAEELAATARENNTDHSNIVALSSEETIESDSFSVLRTEEQGGRAFLAGIRMEEIEKTIKRIQEETGETDVLNNMSFNIDLMQFLSITLELAAGKTPLDLPVNAIYDEKGRKIIFLPDIQAIEYDVLFDKCKNEAHALNVSA